MRNTSFFEKLTGSLRLSDEDLAAIHGQDDVTATVAPTQTTPAAANPAPASMAKPIVPADNDDADEVIEEIVDEDYQIPEDAEVETIEEIVEDDSIDHEQVEEYYEEIIEDSPVATNINTHTPTGAIIHEVSAPPVEPERHTDYPSFKFEGKDSENVIRDENVLAPRKPTATSPKIQPVISWQDEHDTAEHRLVAPRSPLPIDMYELHHEIIIRTLVPGITPENLRVSITRDRVSIAGTRPTPDGIPDDAYFEREVEWGEFARMIELPTEVDVEHAEAVEKYGLLVIRLPKVDARKSQELKIRSV